MTAYNTFADWLSCEGLGDYLDSSAELKDGTSQGFSVSEYSAWLSPVLMPTPPRSAPVSAAPLVT